MPGHDIIVVGASAGGVEALSKLAAGLPADLPASLFVTLHIPPSSASMLPRILAGAGPLPAVHPADGEAIARGRIYVAPPDHHLLVHRGRVGVARGPRENGFRPAVDPLFRTAARSYGRRVIGVVLSGALDDGAAGLAAIKARGGLAVVQEPNEALFSSMPLSAIENVAVDQRLPVAEIGPLLARLALEPVEDEGAAPVTDDLTIEAGMADLDPEALQRDERPGVSSGFTCPECHGGLWELRDGAIVRYRCRVGHAYSGDSLYAGHAESVEAAVWAALRALEEGAALADRLLVRAQERNQDRAAARFSAQAERATRHAAVLRDLLLNSDLGDGALSAGPATRANPVEGGDSEWAGSLS